MNITIKNSQLSTVTGSIGCYIFKEIRSERKHTFKWLSNICLFYQKMIDLCNSPLEGETSTFTLDNDFAEQLSEMIESFLYDEATDYIDDDLDWLCEMVNLQIQLSGGKITNNGKGEEQEIKGRTDSIGTIQQEPPEPPSKAKGRKSKQKDVQSAEINNDELFFGDEDEPDLF